MEVIGREGKLKKKKRRDDIRKPETKKNPKEKERERRRIENTREMKRVQTSAEQFVLLSQTGRESKLNGLDLFDSFCSK